MADIAPRCSWRMERLQKTELRPDRTHVGLRACRWPRTRNPRLHVRRLCGHAARPGPSARRTPCGPRSASPRPMASRAVILRQALSRNHAVEGWVERATGPMWRATRPPLWVRRGCTLWCAGWRCRNSAASCRRERPSWPFHPYLMAGFRLIALLATSVGEGGGELIWVPYECHSHSAVPKFKVLAFSETERFV